MCVLCDHNQHDSSHIQYSIRYTFLECMWMRGVTVVWKDNRSGEMSEEESSSSDSEASDNVDDANHSIVCVCVCVCVCVLCDHNQHDSSHIQYSIRYNFLECMWM